MRKQTWLTIAIAAAAGASIWVLALLLADHREASVRSIAARVRA